MFDSVNNHINVKKNYVFQSGKPFGETYVQIEKKKQELKNLMLFG